MTVRPNREFLGSRAADVARDDKVFMQLALRLTTLGRANG